MERQTFVLTGRNAAVDGKIHINLHRLERELVTLVSGSVRNLTAAVATATTSGCGSLSCDFGITSFLIPVECRGESTALDAFVVLAFRRVFSTFIHHTVAHVVTDLWGYDQHCLFFGEED